ncbi:TRAM domain-containing protein, partial [Thermodesulfatator atlanticus]
YEGLTRNYVSVFFEADSSLLGEIARVKIERAVDSFLYGEIVRN